MPFEHRIPIVKRYRNIVGGKYVLPAIQRESYGARAIGFSFVRCCAAIRSAASSSGSARKPGERLQFYKFLTHITSIMPAYAPAQLMG